MGRGTRVAIKPRVLRWAMDESGYTLGDFAGELRVEPQVVQDWLSTREQPLLGDLRNIARVLRRPTATFLLPAPPKTERPTIAFRHPPGEQERSLHTAELHRIREVARLQRILSWLGGELGDEVPSLPKVAQATHPERVGQRVRELLKVPGLVQFSWKSESEALTAWREALEALGVLVFLLPIGGDSARGFSLFHESAPAIAVNTHWNQAARIFTLFHELAHLLTRTSSICVEDGARAHNVAVASDIERWCESVAAAALMPRSAVDELARPLTGSAVTLAHARKIARKFKVSLRAATLRLIDLGHADWPLYRSIPPSSDQKGAGGGGGGRRKPKIRLDEYGRRTASLVLRGMDREIISPSEAMSYLDVSYKNLEDLGALL
jgi:Zn-dependent peptidase ImmA (M78 family)